jgi:hypothetical protein
MNLQRLVGALRAPALRPLTMRDGRVNCPRSGDVDLDACAGCPDLIAFDGPELRCRYRRPPYLDAQDLIRGA